jgi:hypothetical protein
MAGQKAEGGMQGMTGHKEMMDNMMGMVGQMSGMMGKMPDMMKDMPMDKMGMMRDVTAYDGYV